MLGSDRFYSSDHHAQQLRRWNRTSAQLKSKIARKLVAREQQARRRNLARHVPDAAAAVFRVLRAMADDAEDGAGRAPGPKRARLAAAEDLLGPVRRGEVRFVLRVLS